MAVCNIFSKLTNTTGTFLTFSQYMEDLTKSKSLGSTYNIVPSKFIAIECDKLINSAGRPYTDITLPLLFQEYLENGIAMYKNHTNFDSHKIFQSLFWDTIFNKLNIPVENLHYMGDINIQSYNEVEGMGYSEIYCHIPNNVYKTKYTKQEYSNTSITNLSKNKGDYLEGFDGQKTFALSDNYDYIGNKTYIIESPNKDSVDKNKKSFDINLIVVLYDVKDDGGVKYSNIPLGIYVTGLLNNGKIQNTIIKHVSNDSVYNAGTSYGLRICSRYVASANSDKLTVKESQIIDDNYAQLTRVLSEMSITQTKMNETIDQISKYYQMYKNTLAIFKNVKTNVPYIKSYNNENWWFVNGKPMGKLIASVDTANAFEIEQLWDVK